MPICANPDCRIEFSPGNRKQRYCSLRCRDKKHIRKRREQREAARVFTTKVCPNPDCCSEFETTDSRKIYCSRDCMMADIPRRKRLARWGDKPLLTRECANPDCCKKFETYEETKKYCSLDCKIICQNERARERMQYKAAKCVRCGENAAFGLNHCRRCEFELEADREYRKQQGGWNALSLKDFFLSDPYQREEFWLRWEGAHRPNMASGF